LPVPVVAGFVAMLLLQTNTVVLYTYLPEVVPTALVAPGPAWLTGSDGWPG
jgi:hypothetical protein